METEKPSGTKQSKKSNKGAKKKDKGKQPIGTSRKLRTRPTNKFKAKCKGHFRSFLEE
jgi:hypothetical protein